MANWLLPSLTSTYTNFLAELQSRDVSCALWFNTATITDTNIPTGTVRWNATNNNWEKWSGTVWAALTTAYGINVTGYANFLTGGNPTTLFGSIPYQSGTNITTQLAPNTLAAKRFLTQTGDGTNGAIPGWNIINDGDLPTALTGKTYNGNTFTAGTGILTLAASKTFTLSNTLTLAGTDGSTLNFGAGGTVLYSGGPISATTGTFSGAVSASSYGVVSATTGTFSGALSGSNLSGTNTGDQINISGNAATAGLPQNSQSVAYTTVLADANKHILHPAADNVARTFTIPANASVAYAIGTAIVFINEINTVTIAITTDTLTLAGTGATGSRTLAANGIVTAVKVTATKWYISGNGLT